MLVLGLTCEDDGGAALVHDGRLVAAENEERITRLKLCVGFPRQALADVLALAGRTAADLDGVLIAGIDDYLEDQAHPHTEWLRFHDRGFTPIGLAKRAAGSLAKFRDRLPWLERGYYLMQAPEFRRRRERLRAILRDEFGVRCPIRFVDHHFAHLTSAYFTSGFGDALVLSVDGGGDRLSSRVYAVRDGRWEDLHSVSAYDSLGNYYAYATHLCGFKPMRHEGKVTGLAAHGEPKYVPLLRDFVDEENGTIVNRGRVVFQRAIRELERRLPRGWTREDLAASIQRHFEDVTARYVDHWARRTGLPDVAMAGGVFANVRVNQVVRELGSVRRAFIHPGMTDGGLAAGAALAACVPGTLERTMPAVAEPLQHVYLGADIDEREVSRALEEEGVAPEPLAGRLEDEVARLLAEGHVVAMAHGRMEYGPRALGHRSILYQPTDPSVNDWLNHNLHRTEFMPFAPATLAEEAGRCYERIEGGEHAAEFMTTTFHCTPWMRKRMPGVVHLDGTARPQLVRREVNPRFHAILTAFRERTGLPAVINTSFNMHEEPIVRSARDCVRAFLQGNLDFLALGDRLLRHPRGVTHVVRRPPRKSGASARVVGAQFLALLPEWMGLLAVPVPM